MDYLIAGLGNPGQKYQNTRHNVGFQAVSYIADEINADTFTASSHAEVLTANGHVAGKKVLLTKPQTYMNNSGRAVSELSDYFDISPENILIIHDDLDLSFGTLKFSFNSSAGGHNGVRSVITALDTQSFNRLRIGIGSSDKKESRKDTRSYVLSVLSDQEQQIIADILPDLKEGVAAWIQDDRQAAMNHVNHSE